MSSDHKDMETSSKDDFQDDASAIYEVAEYDVMSGRGACVNAHPGNKKFRAICFARKPEYDAGNQAAKRRIATEVVELVKSKWNTRFLKRKIDKGPWYEVSHEQAIQKACQVMRDYKRPDRVAQREAMAAMTGKSKRTNRSTATEPIHMVLEEIDLPPPPQAPLVENPFGVGDNDVLCGRGAMVNGHIGNALFRKLAMERKAQFDNGNYTEKRALATEIVMHIRGLNPPGRFLKRADKPEDFMIKSSEGADKEFPEDEERLKRSNDCEWEELSDERAIQKSCQVMRDIDRPDRKHREERRLERKMKKEGKSLPIEAPVVAMPSTYPAIDNDPDRHGDDDGGSGHHHTHNDAMDMLDETAGGSATVEEAVAAAMDKALLAANTSEESRNEKASSIADV